VTRRETSGPLESRTRRRGPLVEADGDAVVSDDGSSDGFTPRLDRREGSEE
jgi:hypothetical protein